MKMRGSSSCLSFLLGGSSLLQLLLLSHPGVRAQSAVNVTILHINDHHSHVEESALDLEGDLVPDGLSITTADVRVRFGGAARMVSLLKRLKGEAEASGREVLSLHSGDAMTGTLFYTAYGPTMDAAWMNTCACFDAMVLGNHEFDDGDDKLADFVNLLEDTQVISANLNSGSSSPLRSLQENGDISKSYVKTLDNGDKIGVCGVTVKVVTEQSSNPSPGTTIDEEIASATACVQDLESQGINKIVLLTHVGYLVDLDVMTTVEGVDVVVGGHEHALLADEEVDQFGLTSEGPYAEIRNGACVVTAWEYNKVVGKLDISFDANGTVTSCSGTPIVPFNPDYYEVRDAPSEDGDVVLSESDAKIVTDFLDEYPYFSATDEDQEIGDILSQYQDQLKTVTDTVIGVAGENICHTRRGDGVDELCPDRPTESLVGGGVCLLVAESFVEAVETADFAIQNAGGCRTDILSGDITIGEVFEVLPFENTLVTLRMKGGDIKQVLEDAIGFFMDRGGGTGSYPVSAGLRYEVDLNQPFNSRVTNVEMNPRLAGDWEPLDLEGMFTVAANSFIATPRDGYYTFGNYDKSDPDQYQNTFLEYGQSFVDFIRVLDEVYYPPYSQFSTQVLIETDASVASILELRQSTAAPTSAPSHEPSGGPTREPSQFPSALPSAVPSAGPSALPSVSAVPSARPSEVPSVSHEPTRSPTASSSLRLSVGSWSLGLIVGVALFVSLL